MCSVITLSAQAEDLADKRCTQWLSIRQQGTSAKEIVTFYSKCFIVCTVLLKKLQFMIKLDEKGLKY